MVRPQSNAPQPMMPWVRSLETDVDAALAALNRLQGEEANSNKQVTGQVIRLGELIQEVQKALVDLENSVATLVSQQLASALTNYYTKAQTDAKVANPGNISAGSVGASSVSASGQVSGNTGVFNGGLYSTDARNFVVVTNYAASWIDVNGHFGISPSTRRFKTNIEEWDDEDIALLMSIRPVKYHLRLPDKQIPVLDEDGSPRFDEDGEPIMEIEPGFKEEIDAPKRIGFLAEDLMNAGFSEVLVFDDQGRPLAINYAEWVVPLQMGMRYLYGRVQDLEARLAKLEENGRME